MGNVKFLCQGAEALYVLRQACSCLPEVGCCVPERDLATELTKEDLRRTYDMNIHRLILSRIGKYRCTSSGKSEETLFVISPSPVTSSHLLLALSMGIHTCIHVFSFS